MNEPCDLVAVVDDDPDLRAALEQAIGLEGLRTMAFADANSALAAIDSGFPGVLVTDLRLPGLDGMGLFARLAALDADLPVIVMTGHGDIPTAVDLMGRGAYDFIAKPFSAQRLLSSVARALEKRRLVLENRALRRAADESVGRDFVGTSRDALAIRGSLRRLARANRPVVIEGEQGVGKSLCADLLHRMSARARHAMTVVDCASLDPDSGAATLLGHVSGAVPGISEMRAGAIRRADRGTVVLDNVDRLPAGLHRVIERVIDSSAVTPVGGDTPMPIDVAWVATSTRPLADRVKGGAFPRSLQLRFAGAQLAIPPLRDRIEDAAALFAHFLAETVETAAVSFPVVPPAVLARLRTGPFSGNAREVRALAEEVALGLRATSAGAEAGAAPDSLRAAVARYEAEHIRAALAEASGDVERARASLQLPRKTLYDKLARHGITAADFRRG